MTPLEITLLILVLTIVAFITGKIPFSVISAGIMLSLIMTGVMEPAEAFSGFINTNVVMFVAMFVIGAGLTKTSLIDKAEQLVVRYKDNPKMLIFLACIASSLLASITSATATAAIMISLLVGIANEIGTSRSKLLYPAMACANIATSMTFLGQGASNITWIDIMAKAGAPNELYIWDFTIARIPLLVVSILYMTFVGYKLMPDIDNNTFVDGGHTGRKSAKLSPIKEKIAIIIIVVTILAMLFESVIGNPDVYCCMHWRCFACIKWNFKRKRGIGLHSSADNLFICRGVDLIRGDQNYRCRGCRGGLDDQSDWKYNESVSDYGGIFPDSIFTYPDHVESGNTYDFHSTCCIGLYENWD